MADGRTISRRQFVVAIAGTAAAAAATVVVISRNGGSDPTAGSTSTPPPQGTSATIPEATPLDGVRAVGEVYRAEYPEDTSPEALEAAVPGLSGMTAEQAMAELPNLDEAIRGDFADANVVSVDGWILSVTEAQASGLISTLP